jgi:hypothetical protein
LICKSKSLMDEQDTVATTREWWRTGKTSCITKTLHLQVQVLKQPSTMCVQRHGGNIVNYCVWVTLAMFLLGLCSLP